MEHFTVTFWVTTCVIIYSVYSIIIRLVRRQHLHKQASEFPGPTCLPLIGNAHLFTGSTEDILNRLCQLGKLYSAPYRLWLGNYLLFVINNPEQVKTVLSSSKTMDRSYFFEFSQAWLGTGLLTASGAKWRVHRKLMQPSFSSTILQSFVGVFAARSVLTVEEMERNLDGPEFDVYKYISQCTLHTICETTMGVNLGAQTNDNSRYAKALEKVIATICRRVVSPWLHPNFIFNLTQLGKNQKEDIKFLHKFTDDVIKTKKEELLEQNHPPGLTDNEEDTGDRIPRRKVLLDHLIELSRGSQILSDEAIREEVDTIMVAGSDTTAVVSSFVLLMLASHPQIQENVYQELCEIYGEDNAGENVRVTPEDLTHMTYLERVIKETIRLFPLGPFLVRSVSEDLDLGECTLPAGSTVVLSIIELHRNENYWPDPLKFDPDRFLPEEVEKRDSNTYLPFSGGPRNCIGSKYAMMSMKTLLATVLRRYILKKDNVVPVEDLRLKWEFLLRPADPITLRIERRT